MQDLKHLVLTNKVVYYDSKRPIALYYNFVLYTVVKHKKK